MLLESRPSAIVQGLSLAIDRLEAPQHYLPLVHSNELVNKWRPADFIGSYFYLYDTTELFQWHPSQLQPFIEATSRDDKGLFKYHTVCWSWMKKSAKSTIIAAIVDYLCIYKPKALVRLVGNDLKQADSRVGHYLRENIKIGADKGYGYSDSDIALQDYRQATKISASNYKIVYPNGSIVEMVPIDPTGEAGGNDDLIVFSELWGWKHKSHQDMWAEMTISPNRFGYAQRWIDTYAGYTGLSPILEDLYDTVVKSGERITFPDNDECYHAKGIFSTWVTRPRLAWQTEAYYEAEKANLTENQFKRMHRNQWVSSEDSFIDVDWWDSCEDIRHPDEGGIRPLRLDEPIVIAMDAGITSDCFAMVAISRDIRFQATYDGDGLQADERFVKRYSMAWQGTKKDPLRFYSDNPDDVTPESELKRLISKYNVIQVTFDPYQLLDFCNRMEDETGAFFDPFAQGGEREIGDKLLYDIIKKGGLAHSGNDPQLREHLINSGKKVLSDDKKLRIVKQIDTLKIDLTVAMAMALKRANDEIPK